MPLKPSRVDPTSEVYNVNYNQLVHHDQFNLLSSVSSHMIVYLSKFLQIISQCTWCSQFTTLTKTMITALLLNCKQV